MYTPFNLTTIDIDLSAHDDVTLKLGICEKLSNNHQIFGIMIPASFISKNGYIDKSVIFSKFIIAVYI